MIKENPYQTGNLTDVLKLERLDSKAAARLREEIHYQKYKEVREDQKKGAERKDKLSTKRLLKVNYNVSSKLHGNKN